MRVFAVGTNAGGKGMGSCRVKGSWNFGGGVSGMVGLQGMGQSQRGLRKVWAGRRGPDVLSLAVEEQEPGIVEGEITEKEKERMVWVKNWYPIMPLRDANPSDPYPFVLLGRKMVLWRNGEGEWCCLDDRCAHRQVPLSRGRPSLRDGSLMCSYHGWCFDKKGNCVHIPQSTSEQHDNLCQSDRSKVQAYPVQIKQGLIWVWPDQDPAAWVDAEMKEIDTYAPFDGFQYTTFEIPLGYHTMIEMFFDPSHAPFTHEGVMRGADQTKAVPMNMKRETFGLDGFSVSMSGYLESSKDMEGTKVFKSPVMCTSQYDYKNGLEQHQHIHFVPSTPGLTRVIGGIKFIFQEDYKPETFSDGVKAFLLKMAFVVPKAIQNALLFWMPTAWKIAMSHTTKAEMTFFNQDMYVLAGTEQLLDRKKKKWNNEYFIPTQADIGLMASRLWLDRYSKGDVTWDPNSKPVAPGSLEEYFERWDKHVKHCKNCQSTAKDLVWIGKALRNMALTLFALSSVLAFYPKPVALKAGIACLAFAGICVIVASKIDDVLTYFRTAIPPRNLPGNVDLLYKETIE